MTYHGKIFLLPEHRFFSPSGRGTMGEMGLFWKKRGARKKMVVHYVALNPIVWLLVASINRPLSGCLNQNDSNTRPVMMPLSERHAEERDGLGGGDKREKNEKKRTHHEKRNKRCEGKSKGLGEGLAECSCFHLGSARSEPTKTQHLRNQTSGPG